MLLFTALTILASGPHSFDGAVDSAREHAAGIGVVHAQSDGACPLCDWMAHSTAVLAAPPDVAPVVGIERLSITSRPVYHRTSSVRSPNGRAPPLRFT